MGVYSPIDEIGIRNYRNLGEVEIDFRESPIVALVGENDAGKTSVIKAIETCAMNDEPAKQVKRIRRGTKMSGVVIRLVDGTQVTRIRTKDVNSFEVVRPDGTRWKTGKVSEGLPVEVEEVMGMVREEETGEYIQVRTYEDTLLFAYSPASTNSKVMYDALKVGQITRGINSGKEEANQHMSNLRDISLSVRRDEQTLRSTKVMDLSSLMKVKESIVRMKGIVGELEELMRYKEEIESIENSLGVLKLIDTFNLNELNEIRFVRVLEAIQSKRNMDEISYELGRVGEIVNLEMIDTRPAEKMVELINNLNNSKELENRLKVVGQASSLNELHELTAIHVIELEGAKEELKVAEEKYEEVKGYLGVQELNEVAIASIISKMGEAQRLIGEMVMDGQKISEMQQQIKEGDQYLISKGIGFETCPNCGEQVLIDYNREALRA